MSLPINSAEVQLPSSRIHENAIKAWKLSAFIWGWALYIAPGLFYLIFTVEENFSWLFPVISAPLAFVLHLLITLVFPKIRWKRWRYEVTEKGIDLQRGIVITKRTIVPINRVQHVDTKQGPIYRKYGLSSISLSTAATTHEIPALDDETANSLRIMISELVRKVKEDV
jgi:membrane protein YdbS with pleckstrin-like domain